MAPATIVIPVVLTCALAIPRTVPSIRIDLVIVTGPKLPTSRTEISPPAAVFEIAPANVWQGAVREQGFASSPTPETQVRVAWAAAGSANRVQRSASRRLVIEGIFRERRRG